MILVYTHKITPRVRYIFKHILTRTLFIPISFTTKVEVFVAHNGPKLTYTKAPLGKEFFIKSNPLLFEQGVNDLEINVQKWEEIPCFFATGSKSAIPFDIFAASFYLISRYEEYLPHVKDVHGRYTAPESLAYNNGFLEKPVVDIWAYKLLAKLKEKFPDYEYKNRAYKYLSTIDIDNAFAYKYKNFIRTLGGFLNDIFKFRLLDVWYRLIVVLKIRKDPFDTFQRILKIRKTKDIKTIFFCSIGD
ncbi:MAG: hypothetical protein ACI9WV_002079, partial [Patiriisocius sp.]